MAKHETVVTESQRSACSPANRRDAWTYGDTSEAKYTGVWYGLLGPPF
jgi:hypothetical protein